MESPMNLNKMCLVVVDSFKWVNTKIKIEKNSFFVCMGLNGFEPNKFNKIIQKLPLIKLQISKTNNQMVY